VPFEFELTICGSLRKLAMPGHSLPFRGAGASLTKNPMDAKKYIFVKLRLHPRAWINSGAGANRGRLLFLVTLGKKPRVDSPN